MQSNSSAVVYVCALHKPHRTVATTQTETEEREEEKKKTSETELQDKHRLAEVHASRTRWLRAAEHTYAVARTHITCGWMMRCQML